MLENIQLQALPQEVLRALLAFLNKVGSAAEIVALSSKYSGYLQGVPIGEKLAQSVLLQRAKLGAFGKVEELQAVPYLTDDKLKTLAGVFYVETGLWLTETYSSKYAMPVEESTSKAVIESGMETKELLNPEVVMVRNPITEIPTKEGTESKVEEQGEGYDPNVQTNSPGSESGDPKGVGGEDGESKEGGGVVVVGKRIGLTLVAAGRLAGANVWISVQGVTPTGLRLESNNRMGDGKWQLIFTVASELMGRDLAMRLDFEEGGMHVLGVVTTWRPGKEHIVVRL